MFRLTEDGRGNTSDRSVPLSPQLTLNIVRACARCVVFKKQIPPSTDMPRVLYLKGLWAFCMRADVSHCFHSASTGEAYPQPLPKRKGDENENGCSDYRNSCPAEKR